MTYRCLDEARAFADRPLGEVREFASLDLVLGRLHYEGKPAAVEALLLQVQGLAGASYDDVMQVGDVPISTALPVSASRVAVPDRAGSVDPLEWLPPDRAKEALRKEPQEWEDIHVACHRVPESEEAELVLSDRSRRRTFRGTVRASCRELDQVQCSREEGPEPRGQATWA